MPPIAVDALRQRQLQSGPLQQPASAGLRSRYPKTYAGWVHTLALLAAHATTPTSISADYWSVPQKCFLWQNRQNRQMNSRLPRLSSASIVLAATALVALRDSGADDSPAAVEGEVQQEAATSWPPTAAQAGEPSSTSASAGDKLLQQAAAMLDRRASVSARLRHQVAISGKEIYGAGSYWQQGTGAELRVRLELQIAGQDASLLQVSNSRFLWTDRRLPTGREVSRIDLRQLRAESGPDESGLEELSPGGAGWSVTRPEWIAHSGGLPSVLSSLATSFSFLPPQAMRLAAQSDEPSASIPVFAVVGHWRTAKLRQLLARNQSAEAGFSEPLSREDQISLLNALPARLPQEVLLLVGQSDLFPYRIEYRRLETRLGGSEETPPIPYQLSAHPLAVLELTDVLFDGPIAAGQFDYAPGDAAWSDQTAATLERLRRDREQQLAVRGRDELRH
jgi:hypothetical protein